MKTKRRQKVKNNFEIDFLQLMNHEFFGKTMENVRKHRNIKLITTESRRSYLVSEQNYHTAKFFHRTFISNRNEKNSNMNE